MVNGDVVPNVEDGVGPEGHYKMDDKPSMAGQDILAFDDVTLMNAMKTSTWNALI